MKAFINSQFGYCPLIWMNHSRTLNNRINRIRERTLRIVYNDRRSIFNDFLEKDKSVSVRSRNLQILATELCKVMNGLPPEIMKNIFQNNPSVYNLRNPEFKIDNVKTVLYGTESNSFLGPKIWKLVPLEIKTLISLQILKNKIKIWSQKTAPIYLSCTEMWIQNCTFLMFMTQDHMDV